MLDQSADSGGKDLAVMDLFLRTSRVTAQSLGSSDDRRDGNSNPLPQKPVSDGRVVVTADRKILIFDERLLGQKSLLDLAFPSRREFPRRRPLISDRKSLGRFPIGSQKSEEARLVDAQHLFDGRPRKKAFRVAPQ